MSYQAYVVEVKELREHSNANRLQIATVFGNDVIVGLDFKVGDRAIYFPTDGQLSYEFAKEFGLLREDLEGNKLGGYLDPKKRNINAIRLRGEKSDGLLVGLEGNAEKFAKVLKLKYPQKIEFTIGEPINTVNGIELCRKYIPVSQTNKRTVNQNSQNNKALLKEKYPLFAEHKDTSQLAYSLNEFKQGDRLTISLKIHGTSARTSCSVENSHSFIGKILSKFNINLAKKWELISGSRRVVLETFDGGFYGDNNFRKKYHDFFDGKLQKGESIFYEIVGFADKDKPIMGTVNNKKMNDKSFVKQYGAFTTFTYGCKNGESDIYVYRMTMTNEDGYIVEYPTWLAQLRCEQMGVKHAPVLAEFNYQDKEHLMDIVSQYEDGADPIDNRHIREGVIVRIENRESFKALKQKGFSFKVLEGIIKDNATEPDIEEAQEVA